jgi:hypothetical protein
VLCFWPCLEHRSIWMPIPWDVCPLLWQGCTFNVSLFASTVHPWSIKSNKIIYFPDPLQCEQIFSCCWLAHSLRWKLNMKNPIVSRYLRHKINDSPVCVGSFFLTERHWVMKWYFLTTCSLKCKIHYFSSHCEMVFTAPKKLAQAISLLTCI